MNAMPKPWQRPETEPAPIEILTARAQARAYLWINGELRDIAAAVDPLQDYAFQAGLVRDLGQDCVQAIVAEPFERLRRDAVDLVDDADAEPAQFDPPEFEDDDCCDTCGIRPCTNPSFCKQCRAADRLLARQRATKAKPRPTPAVVVEAIMYGVRTRGLAALTESANVSRLKDCDRDARAEIDQRIRKWLDQRKIS